MNSYYHLEMRPPSGCGKMPVVDNLNSKQLEAVEHRDGALLVVAGAGTGKTRVIAHRIANLIKQAVNPNQILALTFTNKAASEMRERVDKLIPKGNPSGSQGLPFVGTFHSLGVHILRECGVAIGISRWFAIYDKDDSVALIRKCLKSEGFDPKQFAPAGILASISKAKGSLISLADFGKGGGSFYTDTVARVWRKYEEELIRQKALDFDDLLIKTVLLLRKHEQVLKRYQSQWKYIHVDEFQDTNLAQYEMIRLLVGEPSAGGNICVVGDHDQTIYTWRGAMVENIMSFEEDFPNAKVIILEENYRSTSNILDAANSVIKKNNNRKNKNLFTSAGIGEEIVLYKAFDPSDEARFVVETIAKLFRGEPSVDRVGLKYEDVAILYRANFQSRALEEAFLDAGIPYTVLGTRFFERAEVRDILAYVKVAMNPDDQTSFARAVATPRRGVGDKTLQEYFGNKEASEKIKSFLLLLSEIREKLLSLPLPQALQYITQKSGYEEMLKKTEEMERLENIAELVNLSSKYRGLPGKEALEKFLTDAGLASDQDALLLEEKSKKRGVRLMTAHAAKGLEFEHVFIVGLEQDLFPHRPMDDDWSSDKQEEERRLFYVALTRAKKRLYLSHAQFRNVYGEQRITTPSEFLSDIPSELIAQSEIKAIKESEIHNRRIGYLPDIEDIVV